MASTAAGPSAAEGAGEGPKVFQFKVELENTNPVIWRRFQVKADPKLKFWDLHVAIQDVMGWEDKHLHRFRITNPVNGNSVSIGKPLDGDAWSIDESMQEGFTRSPSPSGGTTFQDLLAPLGISMDGFDLYGKVFTAWKVPLSKYYNDSEASMKFVTEYKYDFGDSWDHNVTFEGLFPAELDQFYPRCLEGERAEIPEDLGGTEGIRNLHKSLAKPDGNRNKNERQKLEWLYENKPNYDPSKFDPAEVEFRDSRLWLATRKKYKMSLSTRTWTLPQLGLEKKAGKK